MFAFRLSVMVSFKSEQESVYNFSNKLNDYMRLPINEERSMRYYIVLMILALSGCGHSVSVQGTPGLPGAAGQVGGSGLDGVGCTVEALEATGIVNDPQQYGGALITCSNGAVLITNGATGSQGLPGTPGQSIKAVQFCPNDTPSYPTTFPEFGFIVGCKLYAVYSANGGFLAEIPPGTYSSNAVGSSCTFTVNPDLTISH